ncbi:hypothetical protein HID58_003049 [Brassica napus]|uniref:BnaA01g26490D protein n=2 Tax=Brassica napus TaxID=3708 RepID=A0A078FZW5_BRANA|nr:hypothetical protein HID58_003049 [Brassica napus]CAF2154108.1 unnamed protein product [Brassica napus]CDY18546.1 BnaA01g26490D [Brassica napus]
MARNEEKAQSMLNRFVTMKESENKKPVQRRPYLASECRDLADADKWRHQIMREISRKVRREARRGAAEVVSVGAAKEVLFEEEERKEREREEEEKEREFVVHVPLPDEKEIEKMVLLKKKMELLREYASEDLVQQEKEAKAMLNIHR